jgi:hypothetical protein
LIIEPSIARIRINPGRLTARLAVSDVLAGADRAPVLISVEIKSAATVSGHNLMVSLHAWGFVRVGAGRARLPNAELLGAGNARFEIDAQTSQGPQPRC